MGIEFDELSHRVIGAALSVHKTLGPGFLESIYEEGFCFELASMQIPFERQKAVAILYNGHVIGEHRLDVFVGDVLSWSSKPLENWRTSIWPRCSLT